MDISVVIPTRNRSHLVSQAIESVLNQDTGDQSVSVQVLVVDDGSTDDTPALVQRYPSVQYVRAQSGSAAGARNVGIAHASGVWVAFLDDDDAWLPGHLAEFVRVALIEPGVRFIYSDAVICDKDLQPTGGIWRGPRLQPNQSYEDEFLRDVVSASMVMIHRSVFNVVGLFDESVGRAEDRDLWLRIAAARVPAFGIDKPLVLYRVWRQATGQELVSTYRATQGVLRRFFQRTRSGRLRRLRLAWHLAGWYSLTVLRAARRPCGFDFGLVWNAVRISPVHCAISVVLHRI